MRPTRRSWTSWNTRTPSWWRSHASINRCERRICIMKWITRERVKVDRVACPWLIKKFVDQDAEFLFVPADQVMEIAEREGAIPYDVKDVELGHHGKECSFEAILKKYALTGDHALVLLGKIVTAPIPITRSGTNRKERGWRRLPRASGTWASRMTTN